MEFSALVAFTETVQQSTSSPSLARAMATTAARFDEADTLDLAVGARIKTIQRAMAAGRVAGPVVPHVPAVVCVGLPHGAEALVECGADLLGPVVELAAVEGALGIIRDLEQSGRLPPFSLESCAGNDAHRVALDRLTTALAGLLERSVDLRRRSASFARAGGDGEAGGGGSGGSGGRGGDQVEYGDPVPPEHAGRLLEATLTMSLACANRGTLVRALAVMLGGGVVHSKKTVAAGIAFLRSLHTQILSSKPERGALTDPSTTSDGSDGAGGGAGGAGGVGSDGGGGADSMEAALEALPQMKKYVKMLKLGLPLGAVKQKMSSDGLDPNMLQVGEDGKPRVVNGEKQVLTTVKGIAQAFAGKAWPTPKAMATAAAAREVAKNADSESEAGEEGVVGGAGRAVGSVELSSTRTARDAILDEAGEEVLKQATTAVSTAAEGVAGRAAAKGVQTVVDGIAMLVLMERLARLTCANNR